MCFALQLFLSSAILNHHTQNAPLASIANGRLACFHNFPGKRTEMLSFFLYEISSLPFPLINSK